MKNVFRKIAIVVAAILIIGCSCIVTMAQDTSDNEYQADIYIKYEKYGAVDYDIKFLIDDVEQGVMKCGKKYDFHIKLKSGKHELRFEKNEDSNVQRATTLNVIRDLECSYEIHGTVEYVSVTENYVEYKEKLPEGMIQTTKSSSDFKYENYKTVVSELKKMGFTKVSKKAIEKGFFDDEGEVDSISINGKKGFKRGEVFDSHSKVVVTYFSKNAKPEVTPKPTLPPYETVKLGNYGGESLEWRVLDKKDNATLLITKNIIDYKDFNESTQAEATDWKNSSLRHWLNEDFYQNAFSNEERNAIKTTTVQDFKEDHKAGEQTQDHIFVLSVDQAFSYFESDEDRIAHATEYAKQQKKYPQDSYWLIDSYSSDLYKYLVSPKGILDNKPRVNESEGIRPAMWVSNNVLN